MVLLDVSRCRRCCRVTEHSWMPQCMIGTMQMSNSTSLLSHMHCLIRLVDAGVRCRWSRCEVVGISSKHAIFTTLWPYLTAIHTRVPHYCVFIIGILQSHSSMSTSYGSACGLRCVVSQNSVDRPGHGCHAGYVHTDDRGRISNSQYSRVLSHLPLAQLL